MTALNNVFTEEYSNFKVHMIPCRKDNFAYIIESHKGDAIMIDSTLAKVAMNFIDSKKLNLTAIFATHHHYDHVDELEGFQKKYDCQIFCSQLDSLRKEVKGRKNILKEGDTVTVSGVTFRAVETPGHTKSHLSYYIEASDILFCGDFLFSLGCGRIFEMYDGVYDDFFKSFQKIKLLCNGQTKVYCAHEYTLSNLGFLKSLGQNNPSLEEGLKTRIFLEGKTVPTDFSFESQHNIFLNSRNVEEFKKLRKAKDVF